MSDDPSIQLESADSPRWKQSTRLVVGVLLILLGIVVLYQLRQFLIPFILALLLAYILHPIVLRLQRSAGMRRGLAVGLLWRARNPSQEQCNKGEDCYDEKRS